MTSSGPVNQSVGKSSREPAADLVVRASCLRIARLRHASEITSLLDYVKRDGHVGPGHDAAVGTLRAPWNQCPMRPRRAAYGGSRGHPTSRPRTPRVRGPRGARPRAEPVSETGAARPRSSRRSPSRRSGCTSCWPTSCERRRRSGNEEARQASGRAPPSARWASIRSTCRWTPSALRAHPLAAPFDWIVDGKANVVATWEPRRSRRRAFADPQRPHRRGEPRTALAVG